jgi:hypothetical protein
MESLMPRYNVTFTTTITETVEVEADDEFAARSLVSEFGSDGFKSIDYEETSRVIESSRPCVAVIGPLPGHAFLADAFLKDSRT